MWSIGADSLDAVSGLQFVNASEFVVCAKNGTLYLGDTRDPTIKHYALQKSMSGSQWTFGLRTDRTQSDLASWTVSRLSSAGQLLLSDLRKMNSPIGQAQLNLQQSVPSSDFLTVTWAPALDNYIAVSGRRYFCQSLCN